MKKSFKNLFLIAAVASTTLASISAKADVWKTENQWSEQYELKYKQWLKTSTDAQMFARQFNKDGSKNEYYGIRVDCADLVYSLRTIFSYENKLPLAINNPTSSKLTITNEITRFDKISEGTPRLKAFLTWIYDLVSTHGLSKDTYSVPFDSVGAGTIILTSRKNHHSWTIKDITKTGNPDLIFNSTVGRASGLKVQERLSWPNPAWIFEAEVDSKDETKTIPVYKSGSYAGFRQWRPIQFIKSAEAEVPGYSDEQFTVGISKWKTIAQNKLAKVKETSDQIVMRLLKDACSDFEQRIAAVAEAEDFKLQSNMANKCLDADSFDQFSTPSRDRRFVDGLVQARVYFQDEFLRSGARAFKPENLKIYQTVFPYISKSAKEEAALDKVTKSDNFCSRKINDKLGNLSLAELKRRAFAGRVSANPNDAATGRFGFSLTSNDIAYTACKSENYGLQPSVYDLDKIESEAKKEALTSEP